MKKYEDSELAENKDSAVPKEILQTYFKDAYMRERERFNSMFGTLEYNPPFEYPDYDKKEDATEVQQTLEDVVPLRKYKKAKRATAAFVILSIIFLGAAAFFGAKYFGLL